MESPLKVACVTYEAVRAVVRGNAGVESVKVESLGWYFSTLAGLYALRVNLKGRL